MTVNSAQASGLRAWLASPRGVSTWTLIRNILIAAFAFFLAYSILASVGTGTAESIWGGLFIVALVGAAYIVFRFRPAKPKGTTRDAVAFREWESEAPHHLILGTGGSGKVVMDLQATSANDAAPESIITGNVGHGKTATADVTISPARPGKSPAAAQAIKEAAENGAIVVDEPAPSPEVIEKLEADVAASTEKVRPAKSAAAKSATSPKTAAKTPARKPASNTTPDARKPRAASASTTKRPASPLKPATPKPAPEKPAE